MDTRGDEGSWQRKQRLQSPQGLISLRCTHGISVHEGDQRRHGSSDATDRRFHCLTCWGDGACHTTQGHSGKNEVGAEGSEGESLPARALDGASTERGRTQQKKQQRRG